MKVELDVEVLSPSDVFRNSERLVELQRSALAFWQDIEPEKRTTVMLLVQSVLLGLLQRVDDWVPASVAPRQDDRLDLVITVPFASADVFERRVEMMERHLDTALSASERLRAGDG